MAIALGNPRLVAGRRMAFAWAACGMTIAAGIGLVLKVPYYGIPLPAVALCIALPVWLATTSRTSLALCIVLVYMGVADGVLKLRSPNELPTLGRDVLLYAVVAGMAYRARGPLRLPLGGWLVAWTAVILAQLANPLDGTAIHSIASLRQHLEFVPLAFVGFAVLRTHASLETFFALLLTVAAINGAVGAYQSSLTPNQLAQWGPGYRNLIDGVGVAARNFRDASGEKKVRPPGLGSDMGFAGNLGATALPGGIVLLLAHRRRRWLSLCVVLGLIGAIVGVLTSQSRSALIMAIAMVLATFGLMAVGRQAKRSLIGLCLIGVLAYVTVMVIDSRSGSSTFYRYSSIAPSRVASTTYGSREGTWTLIPQYMHEIPFGAGIGSGGSAAGLFDSRPVTWNAESQFNFLLVEAGIPGLVVFLGFQGALGWALFSGLRRERDPRTVLLLAGFAAPLIGYAAGWPIGVTTTFTPDAAYLWLATGVIGYWLIERHRRGAPTAGAPPYGPGPAVAWLR